jgi:DNA primase
MSRRIPQPFIDELIARADIVDVIGSRITLKKAGREYKGLCPFHDEKTPSFTVSPAKGFYHCFGCGAHGTAISFLMSRDNLAFPEAVGALAEMLSMEVPAGVDDHGSSGDAELYDVLREACQIYRRALREHPVAVDYLKSRGIEGATAARFGIGYAPNRWDTILEALGSSPERIGRLLRAGLVIDGEGGKRYDRFRDRIMFPIRDHRGRVVGFGGRLLAPGEPKYLNSPETPVFHKGRALYGLFEARQRPGRPAEIIVVEGYMDVASLAQRGIEPVVATLGTATTDEHVRRLTRLADRVVFCFDGDRAGRAAAWRALEAALPYAGGKVELDFLLLPEGEDPDSLVRHRGPESFQSLLRDSTPLSEFFCEQLAGQVDLGTMDGRSRLASLARPSLSRLAPGVHRELLVARLADMIGVPATRFEELLAPATRERRGASRRAERQRPNLIRHALGVVMSYPAVAARIEVPDGLASVAQPGAELLARLLEVARQDPQITTAGLLERFREDPEGRYLGKLAQVATFEDDGVAARVLADNLSRILENHRRERLAALLARRGELSPPERAELDALSKSRGAQAG